MHIYLDSYLDNNLGDDLMIIGLSNKFPNITFHIITDNSVVAQHYENYENIKVHRTNMRKVVYSKIDLYLKLGGSIFQIRSIKETVIRYLKFFSMRRLKRRGVRFAIMGCNVGPFHSRLAEKVAVKEMKLCDFITVRDHEAFDFVRKKAQFKHVYLYDDIVFELLDTFDIKNKKDSTLNSTSQNQLKIGVTAYRSVNNKSINWKLYSVVVDFLVKIATTSEHILKVSLYGFDTENENDLSASHHIQAMLNKQGIDSEIVPYLGNNIEDFLNDFQSMDKLIAIRFHGAVLADYFQIPYFPIAYSNKLATYSNKLANYIEENTNYKKYLKTNDLKYDFHGIDIFELFINRTVETNVGHVDTFTKYLNENFKIW